MSRPSTPNYGDLREENGQLQWWNGEKWFPVSQHYDREAVIRDLCERVAQLEARLDKQEEYLQEQNR